MLFRSSQKDVAEAVASVIAGIAAQNRAHDNRTYTLTGSESLSFADIAQTLTAITGTPYRYHNETVEEAFASRKAAYPDTPDWQIEAWVSTVSFSCERGSSSPTPFCLPTRSLVFSGMLIPAASAIT